MRYRKPYRIKRQKPILHSRFFWICLFSFLFIFSSFYFLFFADFFRVKNILITGQTNIAKETIQLLIKPKLEKSIFLVDSNEIEESILANFPQIADIEISRTLPDIFNIVVIERKIEAIWCQKDNCFWLDREGVIFEPLSLEPKNVLIIRNLKSEENLKPGEKVIAQDLLGQFLDFKFKLQENLEILTSEFLIISGERLNIKTSEGWEIYFNLRGDLDWQLQELGLVLEKQIPLEKRKNLEYIDLRFSRVYYKYRD